MAFQVKELMVALEPERIACGKTEGQCPTASATVPFPASDSRHNLELLRRNLAERKAN